MRALLPVLALAGAAVLGGGLAAANVPADAEGATSLGAPAPGARGSGRVDPRAGGFEIALGEWALTTEAKAIRPGPVTLVIRNGGKFVHGFEIELRRRYDEDEYEAESIELEPGQSARMKLNLPPGVYDIECFVGHHDELGMRGVLEVRADAPFVAVRRATSASTVAIAGFAYKPSTLRTTVGKTVTWRNADTTPHTATARQFASPQLRKGDSFRHRFQRVGIYSYVCALHPGMRGKVVVAKGTR